MEGIAFHTRPILPFYLYLLSIHQLPPIRRTTHVPAGNRNSTAPNRRKRALYRRVSVSSLRPLHERIERWRRLHSYVCKPHRQPASRAFIGANTRTSSRESTDAESRRESGGGRLERSRRLDDVAVRVREQHRPPSPVDLGRFRPPPDVPLGGTSTRVLGAIDVDSDDPVAAVVRDDSARGRGGPVIRRYTRAMTRGSRGIAASEHAGRIRGGGADGNVTTTSNVRNIYVVYPKIGGWNVQW